MAVLGNTELVSARFVPIFNPQYIVLELLYALYKNPVPYFGGLALEKPVIEFPLIEKLPLSENK